MMMPKQCPKCGAVNPWWIQRGEPDFDKDLPYRIVDSIEECSECHTLFRFRWRLETIHRMDEILVEEKVSK